MYLRFDRSAIRVSAKTVCRKASNRVNQYFFKCVWFIYFCEVLEQIQLCKLGVTEVLVFFLFRIKFLWSRSTYSTDLISFGADTLLQQSWFTAKDFIIVIISKFFHSSVTSYFLLLNSQSSLLKPLECPLERAYPLSSIFWRQCPILPMFLRYNSLAYIALCVWKKYT